MSKADRAFLHAHGIEASPEALDEALKLAIESRGARLAGPPLAEFSEAEAALLAAGGLDLRARARRRAGRLGAGAQAAVDYAALTKSSLTTRAAAQRLGCNASRVRQRIAARTLHAFRPDGEWRLPAFQFTDRGELPGLKRVLPVLPPDLHPLAVERFFLSPNTDLPAEEPGDGAPESAALSPREWLLSGRDPVAVARIAAAL